MRKDVFNPMRDAHRMKEKYDLSLDNRQIVSLLIAGIVVVGAVFVLGVVVGKKLADGDRGAGAQDLLSALDQKAATLEKVKADPQLTFQDTLTQKASAEESAPGKLKPEPNVRVVALAKPAEPKPEAKVESKPEASSGSDSAEKAVEKPAEKASTVATADDAHPAPAEAHPAAPALADGLDLRPASTTAEHKIDARAAVLAAKARLDHPDGKVTEAAIPTRIAPKESAMQAAIARASEKKPTSPAGAFTLQLSASPTRAEADKFLSGLKAKGYAPYIVQAQVPGKGTWYRVRMGSFGSKDAAGKYLSDFRRETQMEAFVTSTAN